MIVCCGNRNFSHAKMVDFFLQSNPLVYFTHVVDESNNRGVEVKHLVVLIRFYDMSIEGCYQVY